ncbi:MAG: hypothetical protein ABH828_02165 [archaeon]
MMDKQINIALITVNEQFSDNIATKIASENVNVSTMTEYNKALEQLKGDTHYDVIFVMENIVNNVNMYPAIAMKKLVDVAKKYNQNALITTAGYHEESSVQGHKNHVKIIMPTPDIVTKELYNIVSNNHHSA